MHLHPARFMPLDDLLKSKIEALEIERDKGGPTCEQLYEPYMKVLASKSLLVWGDLTEADLDFVLITFPRRAGHLCGGRVEGAGTGVLGKIMRIAVK